MSASEIKIGISSCLLGNKVRFDGQHKRDAFLVETFGQWVKWVPVCPEVEIGLGILRPTLRLQTDSLGTVRLLVNGSQESSRENSEKDLTEKLLEYARRKVRLLEKEDLCGFVLKKDSPSCGMERVKVYPDRQGIPSRSGSGLFARVLIDSFPRLPIEEEGRLSDPGLRENFVSRVFTYHRLKRFFEGNWSIGGLVEFHSTQKYLLLAHSKAGYERLGRLVADAKRVSRAELKSRYIHETMDALEKLATTRKHVNVLQHLAGYFKKHLNEPSRRELRLLIEDYHRGLVPLIVPITLVRHYVRLYELEYLRKQAYLEPHPKELMLRNHV